MRDFWVLIKAEFLNSFYVNRIIHEKNKKEKRNLILKLAFSIALAAFLVYYFYYIVNMGLKFFHSKEILQSVMLIFAALASFFIFIRILSLTQTSMFRAGNYEMIASMPIQKNVILMGKIIETVIDEYAIMFLFILPSIIIYYQNHPENIVLFAFKFLLAFLFLPLLPTILAISFIILIARLLVRFKNKDTLFLISTLALSLFIIFNSRSLMPLLEQLETSAGGITLFFKQYLPFIYYFVETITNFNVVNYLLYVAMTFIPFFLLTFLFSNLYEKIMKRFMVVSTGNRHYAKNYAQNSILKALFKKELKRYFASAIYVLNTSFGAIMLFASSIATLLFGAGKVIETMGFAELTAIVPYFFLVFICFVASISCTTNASISLEGKNFWLLKVLPIKPIQIYQAKIILNMIIVLPITFISILILAFSLKIDWPFILLYFGAATAYSILTSILGIIINLYFPSFKWKREIQVVKQGLSVLVSVFLNMGLVILPVMLYFPLAAWNVSLNLYMTIVGVCLLLLILLSYQFLGKKELCNE